MVSLRSLSCLSEMIQAGKLMDLEKFFNNYSMPPQSSSYPIWFFRVDDSFSMALSTYCWFIMPCRHDANDGFS